MIDKLKIQNIQSHKNSELEFVPGINVIIGSSNNGKSAVLRSLYWAICNRPLGIETLCSHWNLDEKGNIINPMSVKVYKGKKILERRKTKNENQYLLNDEELNAVRTDVPKQAIEFFKLTDTNIQNQQDSPFLLSLSNGDVAKYFNRIAKLDVIDKVLSNAESKRREIKKEVEHTEKLISDFTEKHEKYSWLSKAEKLFKKYETVISEKEKIEEDFNNLLKQVEEFNSNSDKIKKIKQLSKYKKIISSLKDSIESKKKLYDDLEKTCSEISQYQSIRKVVNKLSKVKKFEPVIKKIETELENECKVKSELAQLNVDLVIYNENEKFSKLDFTKQLEIISKLKSIDLKKLKSSMKVLKDEIYNFENYKRCIKGNEERAKLLRKQLPEVCPLCGSKMKNGVCENETVNNG